MKRQSRSRPTSSINVGAMKKQQGVQTQRKAPVTRASKKSMPSKPSQLNADFASQNSMSSCMNDRDIEIDQVQQNSVTVPDLIEPIQLLNTASKQTKSGKAVFGEVPAQQNDDGAQSYQSDTSIQKQHERMLLKELLDSVWPKDPLQQKRAGANHTEIIQMSDMMNAVNRDQTKNPTIEREPSEIKRSLQRITDTELKLGDMISRHIKKHGSDNFGNSTFMVTDLLNTNNKDPTSPYALAFKDDQNTTIQPSDVRKPANALEGKPKGAQAHKRPVSQAAVLCKGQNAPPTGYRQSKARPSRGGGMTPTSNPSSKQSQGFALNGGAAVKRRPKTRGVSASAQKQPVLGSLASKVSRMQGQLQSIMDQASNASQMNNQPRQQKALQHFRPRELFNINTHALFKKTIDKDPNDSDAESQDDEEEINRLLCSKDGRDTEQFGPEQRQKLRNAKIDLSLYDPNNTIHENRKLIENMFSQAKQATNTDRAACMESGRREQLKVVKFFKHDQNIKKSKIARETEEAIKYLNKRQPLTVQNTQLVDDDILFSLPGGKSRKAKQKKTAAELWATRSIQNQSPMAPPQSTLQLQHTGERAKFYKNIISTKTEGAERVSAMRIQQIENDGDQICHQPLNMFQQRRHTSAAGSNTILSGIHGNHAGHESAHHMSRSSSRSKFMIHHPSTFSKQMGQPANIRPQSYQKRTSLAGETATAMHLQSADQRSLADSPGLACFGPNIVVNQPTVINNINLVQQASNRHFRRNRKSAQSANAKRFGGAQIRNASRQLARKTTQGDIQNIALAQSNELLKSGQLHRNINRSGGDLSNLNFYPTKEGMGGASTPQQALSILQTTQPSTRIQHTNAGGAAYDNSTFNGDGIQTKTASSTDFQSQKMRNFRQHRGKSIPDAYTVNDMQGNMARINESMEQRSFNHETSQPVWNSGAVTSLGSNYMQVQQLPTLMSQTVLDRKKTSAVVKVDQHVLEKVPSIGLMEMLIILDARNADMGLKRASKDNLTVDGLERLMLELSDGNGQGPAQRFRDYCEKYSVNRRLILQKYSLGATAAQEIANILAVNPEIVHLDLSTNNLQDTGAEILARVIQNHTSLIHLDLSQNNITPKGAKIIFESLKNNISLISFNIGNTENVNRNRLNIIAIAQLNKMIEASLVLQFLDLRSTNLTDSGLALLSKGLQHCSTLFNLNIAKNDISHIGMEKFAPILHQTNISELDLSLNPLGNAGIKCFAENLWARVAVPQFSLGVQSMSSTIDSNRTGGRQSVDIPVVYTRGTKCKLVRLNLSETKIQEAGAFTLFRMLTDFASMQHLILDYNQLEVPRISSIFSMFIIKTRLQTLSLNYCKIGDEGGVFLGDAISNSTSIRELRAKHCALGDATAKSFAYCIEESTLIERLDLSNNNINDAGGELLGIAIETNRNLKHLNLNKNNMRATTGANFARSMIENKSLKVLRLENNYINISYLEEIAKLIERNNLHMLENNVEELRQDRKGFLETRHAKWTKVNEKKTKLSSKTKKLNKIVGESSSLRENLEEVLEEEWNELKTNLQFIKSQKIFHKDHLAQIDQDLRQADEDRGQAEIDAEKSILTQERMIKDNQQWLIIEKETLIELKDEYGDQKFKLTQEVEEAEKLMRAEAEENKQLKDEIEVLKLEAARIQKL